MKECYEGWTKENGNHEGNCCCNCKYKRPIGAHPWNKNPSFNGRISHVIGWGCTVPDMPNITFSESEHGMCEVWSKKDD